MKDMRENVHLFGRHAAPAELLIHRRILKGHTILLASYLFIVASQPMPTRVGFVEILMGFGLAVGSLFLIPALYSFSKDRLLEAGVMASLAATIIIFPLIRGMLMQHSANDIARDLLPVLFLTVVPLVLFFSTADDQREAVLRAVLLVVLSVGVISALQFLARVFLLYGSPERFVSAWASYFAHLDGRDLDSSPRTLLVTREEQIALFLKIYDPAILFAAIYCLNQGLRHFVLRKKGAAGAAAVIAAGAVSAYCYFIMGLRAAVGSILISVVLYQTYILRKQGVRRPGFPVIATVLGLLVISAVLLRNELIMMVTKHLAVGSNGKLNELIAAMKAISENNGTLFFGIGWGGVFWNPVVGDHARFTHSLISFLLLKAGVIGLAVFSLLVLAVVRYAGTHRPVAVSDTGVLVLLAACAAVLIGLFFQPIYKMLSFGFILALALLSLSSDGGDSGRSGSGQRTHGTG